MSLFYT